MGQLLQLLPHLGVEKLVHDFVVCLEDRGLVVPVLLRGLTHG